MADAIGLAASVTGLVSLGLKVVGGIKSYIDGYKARKEELTVISTSVRHMQTSIDVLRNAIPNLSASSQVASDATTSAIKTCEEELGALAEHLHEHLDFPAQEHDLKGSFRQQKKSLLYPFQRERLNDLVNRLESANDVLQTAIQVLEL